MMKFVLENVKNGCRRGLISEIGRNRDKTVETPMCMLYARAGSAPHLTPDVLHKIQRIPDIAHMPVNLLSEHHEAVLEFGEGLGKFTAMQNHLIYCSVQDPAISVPSGFNDKTSVAVWAKCGKIKLDVDLFMKIQEAFQPDIYECLHDADTQKDSGKKRILKSVDYTLNYLDLVLDKHKHSKKLENIGVFGCVVGGHCEPERLRSARETALRAVDGFCLEGLFQYGPKSENYIFSDVKDLCQKVLDCLPEDKPRFLHGVLSPDQVIQAVQCGLDMFDSTYPYIVTERGSALTFNFDYNNSQNIKPGFEINLKDKKYIEDFTPVLDTCTCYTCKNFTKAYINHLLNTSELLSSILLMIHNFHHYFEFFHVLRCAITEDKYQTLTDLILQQRPDDSSS